MKKTLDLSNNTTSMTYAIANNTGLIREKYEDPLITVEEYKVIVISVLNQAKITKSVKLAIANIERMRTKENIMFYAYSLNLAGSGSAVI